MNSKRVSYAGKQVYIDIDVHRSFFVASCECDGVVVKWCRMPAPGGRLAFLVLGLGEDESRNRGTSFTAVAPGNQSMRQCTHSSPTNLSYAFETPISQSQLRNN